MSFTLPTPEKHKKKDGRLTVILLVVLVFLAGGICNDYGFFDSESSRIYNQIGVASDKKLYLVNLPADDKPSFQIPAQYGPLFFQPLPINSANKELMMTIKGIGPNLAETILIYRQQYGSIMSINELFRVKGIGEKRGASLATELIFDSVE